jgi:hypothetical protein
VSSPTKENLLGQDEDRSITGFALYSEEMRAAAEARASLSPFTIFSMESSSLGGLADGDDGAGDGDGDDRDTASKADGAGFGLTEGLPADSEYGENLCWRNLSTSDEDEGAGGDVDGEDEFPFMAPCCCAASASCAFNSMGLKRGPCRPAAAAAMAAWNCATPTPPAPPKRWCR